MSDDFAKEVEKGTVLIDFWAPWCGPCQMMMPVVEELEKEVKDVKVVKVNIDEKPEIASKYNVMSVPTFLVLKDGKVINQIVGAVPKEEILKALDLK